MDEHQLSLLLVATVGLASPLLYAALGELISETAGVINIQLDGIMLIGAFSAVLGAHISHSLLVGVICGALGGALLAALHGILCLLFHANQIVSGVVLNIFALGVTSFGLSVAFGASQQVTVKTIGNLRVPGLADIPIVGQALFDQTPLVYIGGVLVLAVWWLLNRTTAGLRMKASGENAEAADSLGVSVVATRWVALLTCGALAGVGGAQLTLVGVGTFTDNITAGLGFIALAAVVFGGWRPMGILAAVVLFALADALSIRAQSFGVHIPSQLLLMLPYLVTLSRSPASCPRDVRPPSSDTTSSASELAQSRRGHRDRGRPNRLPSPKPQP